MSAKWHEPVNIQVPKSGDVRVDGPFEALVVLMDERPNLRGAGYVKARSLCRAAIAGRRSQGCGRGPGDFRGRSEGSKPVALKARQ